MKHRIQNHFLLSTTILFLASLGLPCVASEQVVRASTAGAHLDSDLLNGGGTDDTDVLQRLLDRAATGQPVHLIIDGVALVRGLNVYSNTTIECTADAGLYLKTGSNRAMIRNVHRSQDSIKDQHITLRGCFLNGNRKGQSGKPGEYVSTQEADGSWIVGLQFFGVNDLTIENVTVWGALSWGVHFSNATHIDLRNVTIDHGLASSDVHVSDSGTDGLHFNGNVHFVRIDGAKFRTGDNALAFNATDGMQEGDLGPYVKSGPITDVFARNIWVTEAESAVRILSGKERVDRIAIDGVTGTINGTRAISISHWIDPELGNIGSIMLSNINVDRTDQPSSLNAEMAAMLKKSGHKPLLVEFNNGEYPLININAHIEYLSLRNVVTKAMDDRPIMTIGPHADIKSMTVDLNIADPQLRSVPLRLDEGSTIGHLNLSVDWRGNSIDQGKNPIQNGGGSIRRLNWVNTPPMYVSAELRNANTVVVSFSQDIKATDFKAGVSIKRNGQPLGISGALYQKERANEVQYRLDTPVRPGAHLTWAYEASGGNIRNWSGGDLLSVSEKKVDVD